MVILVHWSPWFFFLLQAGIGKKKAGTIGSEQESFQFNKKKV